MMKENIIEKTVTKFEHVSKVMDVPLTTPLGL